MDNGNLQNYFNGLKEPLLTSAEYPRPPLAGNNYVTPPPLPGSPMYPESQLYKYDALYGNRNCGSFPYNLFGSAPTFGYGSHQLGRYSSMYPNSFNAQNPDHGFFGLAEPSSMTIFQSIELIVSAVSNVATMLDSILFAITTTYRSTLGVADHLFRLRSTYSQLWQALNIFSGLQWLFKKILYKLKILQTDPTSADFQKAFNDAASDSQENGIINGSGRLNYSPWALIAVLSFMFTAPYLLVRLFKTEENIAKKELRDPQKWINPIETVAAFDFVARNPSTELSIQKDQKITVAPKEIQKFYNLLNSGWALACTGGNNVGLVPISYMKAPTRNQK